MKNAMPACLSLFVFLCPLFAEASNEDSVTVSPAETAEILANPHMGWETFHRSSKRDGNLPSWIPSTVYYARWSWRELEPQAGRIDAALLDQCLQEARDSRQKLAFRVMCCAPNNRQPYHPKWLQEIGGKIALCDRDGNGPFAVPDLDDPVVLEKHLNFIARLGKRYDGHRDLDHVDLGSIGWWGEWHLSGSNACKITSLENRQRIVAAYLAAFKKTPLLMLLNGGECLKTAVEKGTGWRADCLGDLGGFSNSWNHMRHGYPSWIERSGIQDAWKTAPVAWESCWNMQKWVSDGWPLRLIFNYALALHGSYLNNKSAPLPNGPNVRAEVERFLRRLGYRLVLKELKHPARAKAGGTFEIAMKWQNTGSAPCYRPYRLAYRLTNGSGESRVIASKIAVNEWLPGSIDFNAEDFFKNPRDLPLGEVATVSDTLVLPENLAAGSFSLSIGVVGEDEKPVIRLGIQGRAEDGWYPLSTVQLVE
ncbi:MAG: DUF4832 domain-containing protein [Pirellulales bacterium]|nr:DUF4832 domain-containing protein [Pirellulales bacterium]